MKRTTSVGWIISALLGGAVWLSLPSSVMAQEYLCSATQPSENALPILDAQCPIGDGHWSRKAPKKTANATFWIQCGLLNEPLALAKARPLYQKITTDVWMKPEGQGYRCLIGPYQDFQQASQDLHQVKKLSDYREAFIRVVRPNADQAAMTPAASAAKKPAKTQPKIKPKLPAPVAKPAEAAAAKVAPIPAVPEQVASATQANQSGSIEVQIRLKAVLQGRTYAVPYLMDNQHEFYMEHSKPWNRLDYAAANMVCQDVDMRLATTQEFNALLGSKVMEDQQWPMHLPYWGDRRTGLFADGRALSLKGTSLLNVLCVR